MMSWLYLGHKILAINEKVDENLKSTEVSMMIEAKHWEAAYKKLKVSVYYDKIQALLRYRIVFGHTT